MSTYILGIESSCDDTSAAVIKNTQLLSNVIANQDVHKSFGGVVPELASRAHQQNIIPVVDFRMMMGVKKPKDTKDTVIIVLSNDGQTDSLIGLIVDGVKEVSSFSEDQILEDTIIDAASGTLINITFRGTLKSDTEFIHIINQDDLMEEIEN